MLRAKETIERMERSGERAARALETLDGLRSFYDEMMPAIYRYFFQRCGWQSSTAEDLTQETFLAAAAEIRSRRDVRQPDRWIYGIARHRLIDHFRRREREQRRLELAWEAERVSEQEIEGLELSRERALAALEAVPTSQRAALTLRYLDGLAVPEVASAIGRSVRATESLLVRGRESFRRKYLEAPDD